MIRPSSWKVASALGVTCLCIGAAPTLGQDRHEQHHDAAPKQGQSQGAARTGQQQQSPSRHFAQLSTITGMEVYSRQNEPLGAVSELIVERGSGEVRFLVVERGGVLGVGAKQVTIPYGAFESQSREGERILRLNATPEQLDKAPDFDAEKFPGLAYQSWSQTLGSVFEGWGDDDAQAQRSSERYRNSVQRGEERKIEGRVVEVRRINYFYQPEEVALRVDSGGRSELVLLGPAWHVMTQRYVPGVGEQVSVTAYPIVEQGEDAGDAGRQRGVAERQGNDQDEPTVVATKVRSGDQELALRGSEGRARWEDRAERPSPAGDRNAGRPALDNTDAEDRNLQRQANDAALREANADRQREAGDNTRAQEENRSNVKRDNAAASQGADRSGTTAARLFLASDLVDADLRAGNQDAGDIDDLIVEVMSGRVAFLVVDPQDDIAGDGAVRLVPWQVVNAAAGAPVTLRLQAEQLQQAPKAPDDYGVLAQPEFIRGLYEPFHVGEPDFQPRQPRQWDPAKRMGLHGIGATQ